MTRTKVNLPKYAKPLFKPARYKAIHGGRGSAKSHTFANLVSILHAQDPNRKTVGIREIQKSIKLSVRQLIVDKIIENNFQDLFDIQDQQIKSKRGKGIIIFQGMQNHTADSIKSLEGFDCAWVEEAQTLSQRSLDLLRPTIRKPNSELWFSWNPRKDTDAVDAFLRCEKPPENLIIIEANYNDNPWLPDVLRKEMEYDRSRDIDKYRHVWLGSYNLNSESRVFKNWRVEEFETPKDAFFKFGADWGFAVDPTVLIRCYLEGRTLFVDHEAYQVGCEIIDTPELFLTIPESEKWPIVADSARPETVSHLRKHGFPKIQPAIKGKGSLEDGVEFLKSFDIVVHPRCQHTIDELTNYSYKVDPDTDQVTSVLEDKHNHVIDALRYACEGARRLKRRPGNLPRKVQGTYDPWGM